jgi:hypothetical protein
VSLRIRDGGTPSANTTAVFSPSVFNTCIPSRQTSMSRPAYFPAVPRSFFCLSHPHPLDLWHFCESRGRVVVWGHDPRISLVGNSRVAEVRCRPGMSSSGDKTATRWGGAGWVLQCRTVKVSWGLTPATDLHNATAHLVSRGGKMCPAKKCGCGNVQVRD